MIVLFGLDSVELQETHYAICLPWQINSSSRSKAFCSYISRWGSIFKPTVKKGLVLQIVSSSSPLLAVQQCSAVDDLLLEFAKVFEVPVGLLPLRGHEHQIIFKEGSSPICEWPYRDLFYQKTEIEKIVHEVLETSSIRVSQSHFSSPILLVRKAYGSWHICIYYRSLNKTIVKDKYPILVVDELCGAALFSKLDLR